MKKENLSKPESKKFQVPMIVSDDVIHDFGIKPGDIHRKRIGDRWYRVVMIDADEATYRAYMSPIWAEIKRNDREGRCLVSGKNGKLIRCPESKKCEDCERYVDVCKEMNRPASLQFLVESGGDPATDDSFEDDAIYEAILEDLIQMLDEIDPVYGSIFRLLYSGASQKEMAEALDMKPRTISDYVRRIREIVQPVTREIFDK